MELVVAVAIGLNPFVATFMLAALASSSTHFPHGVLLNGIPRPVLNAIAAVFGLAIPAEMILSKLSRFAGPGRHATQFLAPAIAALAAGAVTQGDLPLPIVAAGGALVAWSVATMVTVTAARASRSPVWGGLGHVPVLMTTVTVAATMIPVALVRPAVGVGLAGATVLVLLGHTVAALRTSRLSRRVHVV